MKLYQFAILSMALALPSTAQESLTNQKDKISYAVGMQIGRSITNSQLDVNFDTLAAGMKAIISNNKPLLDDAGYGEAMTALQAELQAKQAERQKQIEAKNKEAAEKIKKEGQEFLEANKTKPGIVTTASGLQYKVVTVGTGPKPVATDKVIAHYRGTLIDGTEFDSSYRKGEPLEFGVTGVIKGWTEALQLMPVGSKWQLFIPSDLAYGEGGMPPKIRPGSTLLFDVELVGIKPKEAPAATPEKKN
jgi:FKBP-type peptidyl-prolyl cis-trans isomerase